MPRPDPHIASLLGADHLNVFPRSPRGSGQRLPRSGRMRFAPDRRHDARIRVHGGYPLRSKNGGRNAQRMTTRTDDSPSTDELTTTQPAATDPAYKAWMHNASNARSNGTLPTRKPGQAATQCARTSQSNSPLIDKPRAWMERTGAKTSIRCTTPCSGSRSSVRGKTTARFLAQTIFDRQRWRSTSMLW